MSFPCVKQMKQKATVQIAMIPALRLFVIEATARAG
jgi:hypothetical protein